MSLSGSSASRKSIWAMTRLASSSSMNVGRKMIRSLSRREKMSKARSPRGVCSITIGTRAIIALLYLREHLREPSRGRSGNRASCARGAPSGAPRGRRSSPSYAARPAPGAGSRGRSSPPPPPPRRRRRPAPPCRRWPPGGARAAHPARRPAAARPPAWARPTARRRDPPPGVASARARTRRSSDLPHDHRVGHGELVALEHGAHDLVLQLAPLLGLTPRLELLAHLDPERLERLELPERLRELVVERGQDLLLDLAHLERGRAALAAQRLEAMVVGKAQRDVLHFPGLHAHGGGGDLRHHRAAADHEVIAVGGRRLVLLGAERVVHPREVPDSGRAIHRAELRLLLAHLLEGGGHLVVADGARRVLHLDALVIRERDRGLHLHHGHERERRVLLELDFLEIGLVDGIEARLGERLPVDVGDEVLGDLAPHDVGEVQLHERARNVSFAEAGQARLFLDAAVRALPFLLDDVGGCLDGQAPLAGLELLDRHLHERTTHTSVIDAPNWCERGGSNPQRILHPPDPKSGASASFATLAR